MKHILITITALLISLSSYASEKMETEFFERFEAFIEQGDFSKGKLNSIWLVQDTPPKLFSQTLDGLKELKEQGVGESRFHEIYPAMKEGMSKPMKLEGKTFISNQKPYKMIEVKYLKKTSVENGSKTGWSYVLGVFEGKLYMMGMKKLNQTD